MQGYPPVTISRRQGVAHRIHRRVGVAPDAAGAVPSVLHIFPRQPISVLCLLVRLYCHVRCADSARHARFCRGSARGRRLETTQAGWRRHASAQERQASQRQPCSTAPEKRRIIINTPSCLNSLVIALQICVNIISPFYCCFMLSYSM